MRKLLLAIVLLGAVVGGVILFRSSPKPAEQKSVAAPSTSSNDALVALTDAPRSLHPTPKPNFAPRSPFLDSDVMKAVQTAVAAGDREALDAAYQALVEHIKAHPEMIDDYIAGLRSEQNEHVLRTLARALGDSEAVWGEKLTQAAIELAKDSSFQQRQHMMLHLMGQFPEMQNDVHDAIRQISLQDPDSQVKTSAVVTMADWIEKFPDQTMALLNEVANIFNTAKEEDVLAFTYQLLALHKEKLTPEMHAAIAERLKAETDPFMRIPLVSALSAAPDETRKQTVTYLQSLFEHESDVEKKRNDLALLVAVQKGESVPMLRKLSNGGDLLAQDANDYLSLIAVGPLEPETIFNQKATRDIMRNPPEKHAD